MAVTKKRVRAKISFKDKLEKRRADLEELTIRTNQVAELSHILALTIEDESSAFSSEQKKVSILTDGERELIKRKMILLIEKFFK